MTWPTSLWLLHYPCCRVIYLSFGLSFSKHCYTQKCRLSCALLFLLWALLNPDKERDLYRNLADTRHAGNSLRGGRGGREGYCAHKESLAFINGGSILGEREALPQQCTCRSASAAPK